VKLLTRTPASTTGVVLAENCVRPEEGAVWVGLLDLDDIQPVVGMNGPPSAGYQHARVLIRVHGAPLGYVSIPIMPVGSLTARARSAAQAELADALLIHADRDKAAGHQNISGEWLAAVTCPRRFATRSGAGLTMIVCTRDRPHGLQKCLRSLQRAAYDPIEIIIVDNAPSGDTTREAVAALAREDPRIRYTCEPRPGLSTARNHGLSKSRYDIVAFTDDDTTVDPGWPAAVVAGFTADPGVTCVTGLVASSSLDTGCQRYFDSRYSWGEAFEPRRYDLVSHRHPSRLYPFSAGIFGTGANFAVRRSAIRSIGDFDPLLGAGSPGRGGEDLDMFLRVILAGGRICYLPSALVWHRHRADTQSLGEQIYSYGYGLGAYLAKHLLNRQMSATVLGRGVRQVGTVVDRMRMATQESQLRAGGRRLGLTEARGVIAGALCYYQTSRHAMEDSRK
jgi:glycosyltransferase involved in cell wall biosynthesis